MRRTRALGPSRPPPTPSGCSPPTAKPTARPLSPASSARAHPSVHRRPAGPLEAGHRPQPWAVAEGDLGINPMERMKPPPLPEQPVEVVGSEHVAWLLKTCEGRDFTSRRDSAVILVPVDTGMRRAECAGTTLDDVDLDQRIVWCWARAAARGRCRSAARPPRRSTATYWPGHGGGACPGQPCPLVSRRPVP
jgi:integrase